jgi:hypothetical protein
MKPEQIVLFIIGLLGGTMIGYTILPRTIGPEQVTTVTIRDGNYTFNSNRIYDGDKFFIIAQRDTVLRGVVENDEWK